MRLSIETEQTGPEEHVLALAGELDLYTCPEFKAELLRLVAEGARHVVVDLARATFIDSTALAALVSAHRRLREVDGRLSVTCSDANMRRIFELTGLDRFFALFGTRAEALASPPPA